MSETAYRPNTSYGTWNNHGDRCNLTVESSLQDAVSGGDREWRERMEAAGAFDAIASDYRDAINEALPADVALCGNEFYGPAYIDDGEFDGYPKDGLGALDIETLIDDIDLNKIIDRHDVDATYLYTIEVSTDGEVWQATRTSTTPETHDGTPAQYGQAVLEQWITDEYPWGAPKDLDGNPRLRVVVHNAASVPQTIDALAIVYPTA